MEDAFSEHDSMVQQIGGNTSALAIDTNVIPGADNQINIDSYQARVSTFIKQNQHFS